MRFKHNPRLGFIDKFDTFGYDDYFGSQKLGSKRTCEVSFVEICYKYSEFKAL